MLTKEQINFYRKKYNLDKVTSNGLSSTAITNGYNMSEERINRLRASAEGYNQRSTQPISTTKNTGLLDTLKSKTSERADVLLSDKFSQQNPLSQGLQVVGHSAGLLNDIIFEGLKKITPKLAKEAIKGEIGNMAMVVSSIPGTKEVASYVSNKIKNWSEQHPEASSNLEATLNIASIIPEAKLAGLTGKTTLKGATKIGSKGAKLGESGAKVLKEGVTKGVSGLSETITPIEKGVKTVLKAGEETKTISKEQMSSAFNKYIHQAEQAVVDYSKATPLELAGNEAENALIKINSKLKNIGKQKKELTTTIKSKPVGTIITEARNNIKTMLRERTGSELTQDGIKNIKGRISSISDPADLKLIQETDNILKSLENKFPTFRKVDDAIDRIQDLLYKRQANLAVPINSNVESILKTVTSKLNNNLKEIGGSKYKSLNNSYSQIIGTRNILNKALGIDANKGAALMKQLFSPSGTMPRKLFAEIKKLTGIDLVQEATLAKFAMENVGDVRQASLLEQVLRGYSGNIKSSLVNKAINFALEKAQNPIGKAKSIIEKRSY